MADYTVSQDLSNLEEASWENNIKVNVAADEMLVITEVKAPEEGSTQREITMEIMPNPEGAPESPDAAATIVDRKEGEASIKVTLKKGGDTLSENVCEYPA